jgi:hypothetical protein
LTSRSISTPFLTTSTSKVFAVSSASTSTTTPAAACWASSAAFFQLSMNARVGATVRIGGNGDAATPVLRGATSSRTAAWAAIMASSNAHVVGVPRCGRAVMVTTSVASSRIVIRL